MQRTSAHCQRTTHAASAIQNAATYKDAAGEDKADLGDIKAAHVAWVCNKNYDSYCYTESSDWENLEPAVTQLQEYEERSMRCGQKHEIIVASVTSNITDPASCPVQ